jgi:hypothetical protein
MPPCCFAGGLFSVALSVNSSTGFSLYSFRVRGCEFSRPANAQTQVCATAPLALPGALPLPFSLRLKSISSPALASLTTTVSGLSSRPRSLAASLEAGPTTGTSDHPARPPNPLYRTRISRRYRWLLNTSAWPAASRIRLRLGWRRQAPWLSRTWSLDRCRPRHNPSFC